MLAAKELQVEQNTPEWFDARLGKVTSSELPNVLMDEKKAGYQNYKAQLVIERLTGKTPERFGGSKAMEWGHDTEDLAATMYSLQTGIEVRTCGIFIHPWMELADSPDRMVVGAPGTIEIKCKNSAKHLEALRKRAVPNEYKAQVQNHIQMTGSEWCDYVSFDPDFPPESQLFIKRVYKDEAYCKDLILKISLFLDAVEEDIKFLKEYKGESYGTRKI